MDTERFRELVAKAVDSLPEQIAGRLDNVDIVVEDWPTRAQIARSKTEHGYTLLGLYEGVPLTRRTSGYGLVAPDKITLFQKPIEAKCHNDDEIVSEIIKVVQHEIAHHFGISDERLRELNEDEEDDTP